ncbi:MAG: carboxymuconolactone decarboxylase family protein [Deltaproteobacteria bacterium]|nr:carboxymuconolactone decarboxylase family protein [Deltaproteobacteria bacterium]
MSFIREIPESEATGDVKAVYEKTIAGLRPAVRARRGDKLPPIVRIFGLCPALLDARVGFDKGIYRPGTSGLGRRKEELIATQVAALSGCRF